MSYPIEPPVVFHFALGGLQALDCGKATLALSAGVGVWVFIFLKVWQHLLHKESLGNPVPEICGNHLSHLGFRDDKGNGG